MEEGKMRLELFGQYQLHAVKEVCRNISLYIEMVQTHI